MDATPAERRAYERWATTGSTQKQPGACTDERAAVAAKDAEGNSGGHGRPGERINYGGRCNDAGRYGDVHTFMVRLPAWRS